MRDCLPPTSFTHTQAHTYTHTHTLMHPPAAIQLQSQGSQTIQKATLHHSLFLYLFPFVSGGVTNKESGLGYKPKASRHACPCSSRKKKLVKTGHTFWGEKPMTGSASKHMSSNKDRVTRPGMHFQAPQAGKVKRSEVEAEGRRGGWLWSVIPDPATHVLEVWPSIRAIPLHLGAGASTGKKVLTGSGRICSPSTRGFEKRRTAGKRNCRASAFKGNQP